MFVEQESTVVEVGDILEGFCNGYFGRGSYDTKTVLAVGEDWIVVRDSTGQPLLADGPNVHQDLAKHKS